MPGLLWFEVPEFQRMCRHFYGGSGFKWRVRFLLKSSVYWDITPYIPMKVNRRFRGNQRFHLQGRRVSNAKKTSNKQPCSLPAWLTFLPWRWRQYVPPKCRLTLTGTHDIICQKTALFTPATSGIWNATDFFSYSPGRSHVFVLLLGECSSGSV
jgi:hypothetical protein